MKRSEAALQLINHGRISQVYANKGGNAFRKLVDDGMAEKKRTRMFGIQYCATAATPLAMLTKTQFLCAQQLAKAGEIGFNAVPKAQKAHMEKLVKNGWAGWRSLYIGSCWMATPKLLEAIECWRVANEGRIDNKESKQ